MYLMSLVGLIIISKKLLITINANFEANLFDVYPLIYPSVAFLIMSTSSTEPYGRAHTSEIIGLTKTTITGFWLTKGK